MYVGFIEGPAVAGDCELWSCIPGPAQLVMKNAIRIIIDSKDMVLLDIKSPKLQEGNHALTISVHCFNLVCRLYTSKAHSNLFINARRLT